MGNVLARSKTGPNVGDKEYIRKCLVDNKILKDIAGMILLYHYNFDGKLLNFIECTSTYIMAINYECNHNSYVICGFNYDYGIIFIWDATF